MEDVVQDRKTLLSRRIRALEQAARTLPDGLIRALWEMPQGELAGIEELRLRLGFPMTVNLSGIERETNSPGVTAEDLHAVLENASQASAHTVLEQVRNGYVTLQGGHRMGLCGTVVRQGEEITTLRYLTSLTVRIACPVVGQAGEILRQLRQEEEFPSTLILAPPGTGKTTLLRELVRRLSGLTDCIAQRTENLEHLMAQLQTTEDVTASACRIRDEILPAMSALRAAADEAETITASDCWPYPTYGDLLFSVR